MNWVNIKSWAHELASANDSNVWMDKFTNANTPLSPQPRTDCTNVESYNINHEYFVSSQSGALTTPDSNDFIAQDHILSLQEYYSLPRKKNKEQRHIFDDVMYIKKQKSEEPIHLFITGGADTSKTFTSMLLIQVVSPKWCPQLFLTPIFHQIWVFNLIMLFQNLKKSAGLGFVLILT